jgi:uroporphyrin-3 C-methyltransferase
MIDHHTPASPAKTKSRGGLFFIALIFILALIAWGYLRFTDMQLPWSSQSAVSEELSLESVDQRLLMAEKTVSQLKSERSALQQRLSETANRTNLLRDEILGVTERAGLIEESLHALSDVEHSAQDNLRINEAILFLTFAKERWQLSGDLNATIRATELAKISIDNLTDPKWVNLRQTIAQELAAYRALDTDPSAIAKGELDALEALLPQLISLNAQSSKPDTSEHGMTRLLNALIRIQPSGQQTLISPSERSAAKTALDLEMTNARMAILLRNSTDFKTSVLRINQWLVRLYADTPALKERRERLLMVASKPLNRTAPLAGSSLLELQLMQQRNEP